MKLGFGFSQAADGDLREDLNARREWVDSIGGPRAWATVRQQHGADVVRVSSPGHAGDADALFTTVAGLGLAVFTADCAGVVLGSESGVGVAHAGWRGARSGVVGQLVEAMRRAGVEITEAVIGPAIGPCCFEVGSEVASQFPGFDATTTWGTTSVDLTGALGTQLAPLRVLAVGGCTFHLSRYWSHRRDGTKERMAALAWLDD